MATASQSKLMTAEEFMAADLGEGRFELVRGEVVFIPPATPLHALHNSSVCYALESYGRKSKFGYGLIYCPVLTGRDPDTVRGADIGFYSHDRWPETQVGSELPPVVADVVVEIYTRPMSPGEVRRKVNEYLEAQVSLVMVVDSDRCQVALYRPDEPIPAILGRDHVIEDLPELPGFRYAVADFFV
jgi:Uma2 family endonuclease